MDMMSNDYVTVKNLETRKVGQVRRRIAEHPILGKHLEIVPEGTKSFVSLPELVTKKSKKQAKVEVEVISTDLETFEDDYNEKEDEA